MTFRVATAADIPALSAVRLAVKENTLSDPARITPQLYADYLLQRGRGWLCETKTTEAAAGRVVGFCVADAQTASIWALFVLPDWEGQGIARRLLALAVHWLWRTGAEAVTLSTAPGTRADHFYQRQGWQRGELTADGEVRFLLRRDGGGMPVR